MSLFELDKFNLNSFWEKTPNPLKYVLIFILLIATSYFIFSKKTEDNKLKQIEQMKIGITATYKLIDNFEQFKKDQNEYNNQIIDYLKNLHALVEELNETTNHKFDMLLKSGSANTDEIIEKITLLNESFNKISKIYQESIKPPKPYKEIKVLKVLPNGEKVSLDEYQK
jgi:hypothetical protein